MKLTKKHAIEDYPRLQREHDLLQRYFWDTQSGMIPDKVERYRDKNGKCRIELWGCGKAHGGYVVIDEGTPYIYYLDDANRLYEGNCSEHTVHVRICLERVTAYRNVYSRMHASEVTA